MSVSADQLLSLYLAYFGRPPDVAGVRYYMAGNFTLDEVVRGFSASPESLALHGGTFGVAQINAIYQNLFNRDAEPAGQQFWLEAVNSGRITAAQAALAILQGAQNADRISVQNKLTLAGAFLAQLDTDREIAGYSGNPAAALARAFIKTVDGSASSLAAAQAVLLAQVNLATGLNPPPPAAPPPAPPAFSVTKDGGNIVSFGAPGAQVGVSEAGGTFTFSSTVGTVGTATVTGPVAGVVVPTGTTFSISSALASGKTFSGAGTALVVAGATGEDLTAFTATGVTGFALTSGQNYTLTAAQAAIGRIGAGGAAGTLTDAGTTTVRDTLAALGSGTAATLKANGADSVIATAAPADISATTVAGIDSIVLAAGSYTMTAAQAALANGTTGAQTVTLTTLASGTLNTGVESFELGNFANSVTLGTTTQDVSSAAGAATTLAIGGTAPTGAWNLRHSGDTLVATTGANISGVNAGTLTKAENLTLTGAITMTRDQHEGLIITAGGGSDAVTITTAGIVTARADIESYTVSGGGANTLTVNAGATGITGNAGNVTTVNVGGNTVSGTWVLGNGADKIIATGGANISGINSGAITSAENLDLTGAITMTQAQHQGLAITAAGVSDAVTITTGGAVTRKTDIESYNVSSGGANNLTVLAGATQITGSAANASTVLIGGSTVSGTWALANGSDTIVGTDGSSIAGVNAGGATTAENLTLTGGIVMTQAQHQPLVIAAGGVSDSVTITDSGSVTAAAAIEAYVLNGGASLTLNAGKPNVNVTGAAGTASAVVLGAFAVGGTWALGNANDTITAGNGASFSAVNAGAATTAERMNMVADATVGMTAAQYSALNNANLIAPGTAEKIGLTTALTGGQTLHAAVENFTLTHGDNSVTLGAAQSIDATAMIPGQTLTLAGGFAATVSLSAGSLSAASAGGGLTVNAGTGANTITTGAGNDTVNAGDGDDIVTGGAGIDTLNGQGGNDTFRYTSVAEFYALGVVDLINGGADTDAVVISGSIVLTGSSNMARMTNVEQIKAETQSATPRAHSIVLNSGNVGGVNTVDLSGDTNSTSSATIDFTGVTGAVTLKGVGAGSNTITGGSGADTLVGGAGNDVFLFGSAAAAAADTVTGGGGTDTVLFRSTAGETLAVGDNFSAGMAFLVTTNSTAGASAGTTAENLNASTRTLGGVKLTGNGGNNILTGSSGADTLVGGGGTDTVRGGAGNDTITTVVGDNTTYVFEATGNANGLDTLTGVRSTSKFKFSDFLVTGVSMKNAAVDATNGGVRLDLTGAEHIGIRYANSSLTTANIVTTFTNGVAGQVLVADNGKAVVFSSSANGSTQAANGDIYYVEDVQTDIGTTDFRVTLVGSMSGTVISVSDLAGLSGGFL